MFVGEYRNVISVYYMTVNLCTTFKLFVLLQQFYCLRLTLSKVCIKKASVFSLLVCHMLLLSIQVIIVSFRRKQTFLAL
jgi:hypothetical protein